MLKISERRKERKKEVEAIVVEREGRREGSGREIENIGEKTMAYSGAWLSTVAAVGINTGCRRHLRRWWRWREEERLRRSFRSPGCIEPRVPLISLRASFGKWKKASSVPNAMSAWSNWENIAAYYQRALWEGFFFWGRMLCKCVSWNVSFFLLEMAGNVVTYDIWLMYSWRGRRMRYFLFHGSWFRIVKYFREMWKNEREFFHIFSFFLLCAFFTILFINFF